MSEQPAGRTKVCAACGADVASKPRVKDAQGRYYCKACAGKMRAELATKVTETAEPAIAPGDPDIMASLVADSMNTGANSCPACRRPWKEGAQICTGCGFNRQTGQIVGTQIKTSADTAKRKKP